MHVHMPNIVRLLRKFLATNITGISLLARMISYVCTEISLFTQHFSTNVTFEFGSMNLFEMCIQLMFLVVCDITE